MKNITDFNLIASLIDTECDGSEIESVEKIDLEQALIMQQVHDILENYQDPAIKVTFSVHEQVLEKFCRDGLRD